MLVALALALMVALGLGVAAYALTSPDAGLQNFQPGTRRGNPVIPSAEFIFFSIFALLYLVGPPCHSVLAAPVSLIRAIYSFIPLVCANSSP